MWVILLFGILIASANCALHTPLCPDGGEPVCAKDGVDYIYFANECKLNVYSYKQQFANKPRPTRVAIEYCFSNCKNIPCPAIYQPVCAKSLSRGQVRTVDNICLVNQLICESKEQWVVIANSACSAAHASYPTSPHAPSNQPPFGYQDTQVQGSAPEETAYYPLRASAPSDYTAPGPVASSAHSSYTGPSPALKQGTVSSSEYAQAPAPAAYPIASPASKEHKLIQEPAYYPAITHSADHAYVVPSPTYEQESRQDSTKYPASASSVARAPSSATYFAAAPAPYTCPSLRVGPPSEQSSPRYTNSVPLPYSNSVAGPNTASDQEPASAPAPYPITDGASDQYPAASPPSHSYLSQDPQPNPETYTAPEQSKAAGSGTYLTSGQDTAAKYSLDSAPAPSSCQASYTVQNEKSYPPKEISDPYIASTRVKSSYSDKSQERAASDYPGAALASAPTPFSCSASAKATAPAATHASSNSHPATSSSQSKDYASATAVDSYSASVPAAAPGSTQAIYPAPATEYISAPAVESYSPPSSAPVLCSALDYVSTSVDVPVPASCEPVSVDEGVHASEPYPNQVSSAYAEPEPIPPASYYTAYPEQKSASDSYIVSTEELVEAPASYSTTNQCSAPSPASVSYPTSNQDSPCHEPITVDVPAPASCEPVSVDDGVHASEPYPNQVSSDYAEPEPIPPTSAYTASPAQECDSNSYIVSSEELVEAPASYSTTNQCSAPSSASVSYPTSNQDSPCHEPITEKEIYTSPPSAPHQNTASLEYFSDSPSNSPNYLQQAAPSAPTSTHTLSSMDEIVPLLKSLDYNNPTIARRPQYITTGNSPDLVKWIDSNPYHQRTYGGYGSGSQIPFYYQPTYTFIEYHGSKSSRSYK